LILNRKTSVRAQLIELFLAYSHTTGLQSKPQI